MLVLSIVSAERTTDFTPWPHSAFRADAPAFGGGADACHREFLGKVLPELLAEQPVDVGRVAYGGYSLGGLAAAYSMVHETAVRALISLCGSFWYPDFIRYCETQEIRNRDCVLYLQKSIRRCSDREENMSEEAFRQDLDEKQTVRPGGPFVIELLFRKPVDMPPRDQMSAVIEKHVGKTECFCHNGKTVGFAALDYIAEFKNQTVPVQLILTGCTDFHGEEIDDFLRSQMWDCQTDRERILEACKYQVLATDMLAGALPAEERAALDSDFLEALLELYPSCEAVYIPSSGKLLTAGDAREHGMKGLNRFIFFGVNARFFNVQNSGDMLVDTVGMSTLFLPDLQYHFHRINPNQIVNHAYDVAAYLLNSGHTIADGDTVDGIENGRRSEAVQWKCRYEDALVQPVREVLDINMGEYASGKR